MAERTRDRAVARHEAAHALVMLATGCRVRLVTVEPDGDSLGRAQLDLAAVNGTQGTAADELTGWQSVCALVLAAAHAVAGPVADEISGRRPDGQREGEAAAEMVVSLTGIGSVVWLPVLRGHVRLYLTAQWPAVERIADALLQRGTLGDAELRALVGEVPRLDLNPTLRSIEHHVRHTRASVGAA